jgi:transglutaminase superfamily protein
MYSKMTDAWRFKSRPFSLALILWSLLSLLYVSLLHPIAIGSVLFVVVAFFFQDRLALDRKGTGLVAAAALLMCYACTRILSYDNTGIFLGIGTMSLTILACWLIGISLIVHRTGFVRNIPIGFAGALLIGCSMTIYIKSVAVMAIPAIVLMVLSLREALGLKGSLKLIAPLVATICVMLSLATLAHWSESRLSYLMGLFSLLPPSGYNFPTATSLSALQRWNNSDIVVLRGYGSDPPTYLVGRTFAEFDDKNFWRWKTTKEELVPSDQILLDTRKGRQAISLFSQTSLPQEHGPPFRMEYPKASNGLTIYHPRHLYGVAADIGRLHFFDDGMIQVLAKDELESAEYFLVPYKQGWGFRESPEQLSQEEKEKYLLVPDNLTPEVARLAEEIAGRVDSPEQKADFITSYLQQNFTYGYDFPFESTQTALEEFLTKRPPAHCEFFATSAALMLREQGVPTRYINGFVLQEKSLDGSYYVVRLKHAHAWIEAYLPDKGWVTFDPTPPGTLGDTDDRAGLSKSLIEMVSNFWRIFTNFFSKSPTEMLEEVKTFVKGMTFVDYLKLICLLGLWGLWKIYKRKRPGKAVTAPKYFYTPRRLEGVTPLLERVEATIEKPDWKRRPSETPVAWVERLSESECPAKKLEQLKAFAQLYTRIRFRDERSKEELQSLQKQVEAFEEASPANKSAI